ncbi:tripartite tricarboxylate transporter substrate binding protein [Enhydrobacter sp.]|jgi:tripartite-type tricarboxylate transporter receptor subunit TctC|uniref:Bug family tripartite tricarboxylate transporter substrate binding protein n=1 Tax=Enhydrobacter sp. TaxID=1894999 RepID=UPI00260CC362|nr:tripartite tricarboxylate transporter substrate binding protein [Enhydrobacter sp.]WIM14472.1 MAG: BUG/TctC family periplasmic protein [Enhydrobacter sp.]
MIGRFLLVLAALMLPLGAAQAGSYPSRPIHLVIGYAPGGGNDLIARIVAAKLEEKLGQPVVVENKPGAQSIVAAELVAKAPPDGYTLFVAPSGPLTVNPAVYSRLPYDPEEDFAPISLLADFPLLLVVGPDQPVTSVPELVAYGRAHPELANYASAATAFQLASELFNQRTGSRFQYIPYKGSGEMARAVMSGQVLMAIADTGPLAGPVKGGKLRALAVTTPRRSRFFPEVPTLTEVGIADMEISLWTGIVAPAGTPDDVVDLLQKAIAQSLELPDVRAALEGIAVDAHSSTAEEYRDLIARDIARWKEVAGKANIKLD